jgi:hypothetical protein
VRLTSPLTSVVTSNVRVSIRRASEMTPAACGSLVGRADGGGHHHVTVLLADNLPVIRIPDREGQVVPAQPG